MRESHAVRLIGVIGVIAFESVFQLFAVAVNDPAYRATFTSTGSTPAPVYMATESRPRSNATRSA
jgi:hypothetical protein